MAGFVNHPAVLFVILLVVFVTCVASGASVLKKIIMLQSDEREGFALIQTSTLTLLAFLVGFSLSMAVGRYDQRKILKKAKRTRLAPNMRGPTWWMR